MPLTAEQRRAITKDLYCRIINHIMLIPLYNFFNAELPAPTAYNRDGATQRTLEIFKIVISDKNFEQGEPHDLLALWNTTINASMAILERSHKPVIYQELRAALDQVNKLMRKLTVSETSTLSVSEVITALERNLKDMALLREVNQIPTSVDALLDYMALTPLPQSNVENRIAQIMSDIAQARKTPTKQIIQGLTTAVTTLLDDIKKSEVTKLSVLLLSEAQNAALEALATKLRDPAGKVAASNDSSMILNVVEELVKTAGQYIALIDSIHASQLDLGELSIFVQKRKAEKLTQQKKVDEYKSHLLVDVVEQAARDYCNKFKGQSALENTAIFVFTAVTIIKTLYGMKPLHQFKSWGMVEDNSNNIAPLFKFPFLAQKDSNIATENAVRNGMAIPEVDAKKLLETLTQVSDAIAQEGRPAQSASTSSSSSSTSSSSSSSSGSSSASTSLALIPHKGGTASFLASLEATYNIAVNTSVLNFVRQLRGVEFLTTIQTKYYGMFGSELTDKEALVEPIVAAYYGLVSAVNRQADRIATLRKQVTQKLAATAQKDTKESKKLTAENTQLKNEQERLLKLIYLTTDLAVAAAFRSNHGEQGKADVKIFQDALEALYWYELFRAYDFEKARESFFKKPERQSEYYCDLIKAKYPNFAIDNKDCSPLTVQTKGPVSQDQAESVLDESHLRTRQEKHATDLAMRKAARLQTLIDLGSSLKTSAGDLLKFVRQGKLGGNWEQEAERQFLNLKPTVREFLLGAETYPESTQIQDFKAFIIGQLINNWESLISDARGRYVVSLIAEFNTILSRLSAVNGKMLLDNIGAFATDIATAIDLRIKISSISVNDNILQNYKPDNLDIYIRQKDDFLTAQVDSVSQRTRAVLHGEIKKLQEAIGAVTAIVGNKNNAQSQVKGVTSAAPSPISVKVDKKKKREKAFADAKAAYQSAQRVVTELQNLAGKIKPHVDTNQSLSKSLMSILSELNLAWEGEGDLKGINQAYSTMVLRVETEMARQQQQDSVRANTSITAMNQHCDEITRFVGLVCGGEIANIEDNHKQLTLLKLTVDRLKGELLVLCEGLESEDITNAWTTVFTKYQNLLSQIDEANEAHKRYNNAGIKLRQLTDKQDGLDHHSVLELFTARINEFAASVALTKNLNSLKALIEEFYKAFPPSIFSRLENVVSVDDITNQNVDVAGNTIKQYANALVALLEGFIGNFDKRLWSARCDDLINAFVQHYRANSVDVEYLQTPPRQGVVSQTVVPIAADKILAVLESFAPIVKASPKASDKLPSSSTTLATTAPTTTTTTTSATAKLSTSTPPLPTTPAATTSSSSTTYAGVANAIGGGSNGAAFAPGELDAMVQDADEILGAVSSVGQPLSPTTERDLRLAVSRVGSPGPSSTIGTPAKQDSGTAVATDLFDIYDQVEDPAKRNLNNEF